MSKKNRIISKEKKSKTEEIKRPGLIDTLWGSFTDAGQLVFKKAKPLAINIFKISLAIAILNLLANLLPAPNAQIANGSFADQTIAYAINLISLLTFACYITFRMVQYRIIDYEKNDKQSSIIEHIKKCWKGIIALDVMLILFILGLNILVSLLIGGQISAANLELNPIAMLFSLMVLILVAILCLVVPIAHLEVAINEKDPIKAIVDSINLVRKNFLKTTIFYFPFVILSFIFLFLSTAGLTGQGIVLSTIQFLIFDTLGTLLIAPTFYFFWKRISD